MNNLMTKSFMNYAELKKQAQTESQSRTDLEAPKPITSPAEESNLAQFFQEIDMILSEIDIINSLLSDLNLLHQESKLIHVPRILHGLRDRMDSNINSILRNARIIKARLQLVDRSNLTNRNLSTRFAEGSLVDRTRISVTNGIRSKLRETMIGFQILREKIVSDQKENMKMRYFNSTGEEPSEAEIERMMREGPKMEILGENKNALNLEVQDRDKVVNDIRNSLVKLHQVFLDMDVIVDSQEEKLNDIEMNVGFAKDYVSGGNESLAEACKLKKRNSKVCILWVFVVAVLMFLVCLIPIFARY
ncbi:hypothetical protein LUZ60_002793 [Juncus effusus]|nr:hypothetical protein LUZ60_002793 [Juncus effusus]